MSKRCISLNIDVFEFFILHDFQHRRRMMRTKNNNLTNKNTEIAIFFWKNVAPEGGGAENLSEIIDRIERGQEIRVLLTILMSPNRLYFRPSFICILELKIIYFHELNFTVMLWYFSLLVRTVFLFEWIALKGKEKD